MPLKIVAARGGQFTEEVRISPVIAVALARVKIKDGWYVEIVDKYGEHYQADSFDRLLSTFGQRP